MIAEALLNSNAALAPGSRDADREKVRDWLASQTSPEKAVQGLTGPLYFDENQTLPQPMRVGRSVEGRYVSAPIQLQAIPNPALIDLDKELDAGHVIRIDQRFYWFQRPGGGVTELRPLANWDFTQIRYLPDTLRSTSTRGHPGAFHGEYETEFSGFDVAVGVQRKTLVYLVKSLLPLLLLVLAVYTTLHFPVSLTKERLTIAISAMLASAVLLTAINLQLTDVGYTTAIEYGFYAFFALCLFCVVAGLTAERLNAAKHHDRAVRLDIAARFVYVLVMLGVFAGYMFKYGFR